MSANRSTPLAVLSAAALFLLVAVSAGPISAGEAAGITDLSGASGADVWSQWRGPSRDGRVDGVEWPDTLSDLQPLWHVELGRGYSSPIVTADRVLVAETIDGKTEGARAFDRASGNELWRVSWPGKGSVPFFARANGDWIRSTPAWDGEALYVGGMEEVLHKLDGASGKTLWSVDFPERFGTKAPEFGFASSPLIDGGFLYVQAADSIVKLDRATGETVWRALAEPTTIMDSGAFSSPVIAELAGVRQLVVLNRKALFGVDLATGGVLWQQDVPHFRGMHILTPTVWGDHVFTSPYKQRSFLYAVETSGDGFASREVWDSKVAGYMSSPVVVDDHLYLHLGNERVTCIDLETGETRWTSTPYGKYWSMTTDGNKILGLDSDGELHLLRASPEKLELLASREIADSPTWAHLAVVGDELFVRELEGLTVYRWR